MRKLFVLCCLGAGLVVGCGKKTDSTNYDSAAMNSSTPADRTTTTNNGTTNGMGTPTTPGAPNGTVNGAPTGPSGTAMDSTGRMNTAPGTLPADTMTRR